MPGIPAPHRLARLALIRIVRAVRGNAVGSGIGGSCAGEVQRSGRNGTASNPDAPEDRFIGFVKWIYRKPAGGEGQPIGHVPGGR
jgi:hypothetical protein